MDEHAITSKLHKYCKWDAGLTLKKFEQRGLKAQ